MRKAQYFHIWYFSIEEILLNPRQIKGSKEMITSIYTKLFVLFYHLFFLLDNGSFQDTVESFKFVGANFRGIMGFLLIRGM